MVFNEGMLIIQAQHPVRPQQCNINYSQPVPYTTHAEGADPVGPVPGEVALGFFFEGKGICVKPGHLIVSHLSKLSMQYKYDDPTKKALSVWWLKVKIDKNSVAPSGTQNQPGYFSGFFPCIENYEGGYLHQILYHLHLLKKKSRQAAKTPDRPQVTVKHW